VIELEKNLQDIMERINFISTPIGVPQGLVFRPILFSLYTKFFCSWHHLSCLYPSFLLNWYYIISHLATIW